MLAFVVLACLPAVAQRDWRIQDFHSDIDLHQDGSAEVNESITLLFHGEYHGIDRFIPVDYPDPRTNSNFSIDLSVKGVTDDAGNRLKYKASHDGRNEKIRIYIPGAVDTTKVVRIRYDVENATKFFAKTYDEFYWNVTGTDWPVPIDAASAVVHFPHSLQPGQVHAKAFTGLYGSQASAAVFDIKRDEATFESSNRLSAREGMSVDLAFPKGVLSPPSGISQVLKFVKSNSILLLPIWATAVMWSIWNRKGRDAMSHLSVVAEYEPPKGMSPAECGTLVDDRTDPRDITSTLIDLAVRGYMKIRQLEVQHMIFKSKDYELVLLKGAEGTEWASLAPFEQIMLNQIFSTSTSVYVSSLKNHFYVAVPKIRESVMSELDRKGMYAVDPNQAFGYLFLGAVITAAPFIAAAYFFHADFFHSGVWAIGAIVVSAIVVILFGKNMTATTQVGSRTKAHILGLKEFMARVDADRLKRMPPDTFEKYLAYAMALGVEERWAKAFSGLVQNPPSWYESPGGFYPGTFNTWYFTQSLGSMVSDTSSAFMSSPAPSATGSGFGGGSGGGGFSGGGFGGGGGDAF
ncbi:MAG TPA: DUF2207 domain-containing protein [Terriglobales bacterium]